MTIYNSRGHEPYTPVWKSLTEHDIECIRKHSHIDDPDFGATQSGKMMKIIPDLNLFHFNGNKNDVFEYMRDIRNDDAIVGRKLIAHIKMNEKRHKKLAFYEPQIEIHPFAGMKKVV